MRSDAQCNADTVQIEQELTQDRQEVAIEVQLSLWSETLQKFREHGYTISDEEWPLIVDELERQCIRPDDLMERITQYQIEFGERFPGFKSGKETQQVELLEGLHHLNDPIN